MSTSQISYNRHRFPPEIIAHAVLLYARFNLSLREIEEILHKCGIDVSYETVRRWMVKFGPEIARNLRRRQARADDIWHLDGDCQLAVGGGEVGNLFTTLRLT